jgi:hypothetical protein
MPWGWWQSLTPNEQAWIFGALTADSERTERILQLFQDFQRRQLPDPAISS